MTSGTLRSDERYHSSGVLHRSPEPDRASLQITTHRGGNEGPARPDSSKPSHVPRPALLAAFICRSRRVISRPRHTEDVPVRLLGRNRPAPHRWHHPTRSRVGSHASSADSHVLSGRHERVPGFMRKRLLAFGSIHLARIGPHSCGRRSKYGWTEGTAANGPESARAADGIDIIKYSSVVGI